MTGIRLDGEIMELNTSITLAGSNWAELKRTEKEVGQYQYRRVESTQFNSITLDHFRFDQSVEALGAGKANVRIQCRSEVDTSLVGAFFKLELPSAKYDLSTLHLKKLNPGIAGSIPVAPFEVDKGTIIGLEIKGSSRNLTISLNEATQVIICKDPSDVTNPVEVYFVLASDQIEKEVASYRSFQISATGMADLTPVTLSLNTRVQGRPFKGFGGNFRLQNRGSDPAVIDFCLENMDVRWGRVEMPWSLWQAKEEDDPISLAEKGDLNSHVKASMEMGARLHKLGMPVILSGWSAPDWAIVGTRSRGPQPGGLRGNPLDQSKAELIYKSIADYIQYVKDHYGFEFTMFSFNESDLGINIRQTPEEHAKLIRELGAYLVSRGIHTKLLLGDTADVNGWPFLKAAMDDPGTHPYIGAVSFHSWRGYSDENLKRWAKAAEQMNLPLLVGEGSMDAGAHRYPDVFEESMYAMEEMNLYVRILKICQPESILQWQLTADYSPMSGGGTFGEVNSPLVPTQRFWNFKQIADMPEGLFAMPIESDHQNVLCAAMGHPEAKKYVVHVVNNGASRQVNLLGLPDDVRFMQLFVTNERTSMASQRMVRVRNGEASFFAESNSFITLLAEPRDGLRRGF